MPVYERPGKAAYVVATKQVTHGNPATESGFVGIAVKQHANPVYNGLADVQIIKVGEQFLIRTKGICQVDCRSGAPGIAIAALAKGAGVWINPADNTLKTTSNSGANLPYGRVIETPGDNRGVPQGFLRIDRDQKDTL